MKMTDTDRHEAEKWRTIAVRLAKALARFSIDCGEVHHQPNEYHNSEPCPVCEKINKTIEDFDNLLKGNKK